jgi:hemerythrin
MLDTHDMTRQHDEIMALCQKLDEAVNERLPQPEIYHIMDDLMTRTNRHFRTEERLMAETGVPEIEQHKARHRELLDRTGRFRRELELYGEDSMDEWSGNSPFNHIRTYIEQADQQLAEYVKQHDS